MTVILHKKLKSWWQVTRTPSETIFMQVEKKHARTAGNLHQRRQWRRSAFLEHRAIFEVKTEGCATTPILEKVSCGGLVTREQRLLSWQAIPRSQPFHAGGPRPLLQDEQKQPKSPPWQTPRQSRAVQDKLLGKVVQLRKSS